MKEFDDPQTVKEQDVISKPTEEPESVATKEPEPVSTEEPESAATKEPEPEPTEAPESVATKEPEPEPTEAPESVATKEPEPEPENTSQAQTVEPAPMDEQEAAIKAKETLERIRKKMGHIEDEETPKKPATGTDTSADSAPDKRSVSQGNNIPDETNPNKQDGIMYGHAGNDPDAPYAESHLTSTDSNYLNPEAEETARANNVAIKNLRNMNER